MTYPFTIPRIIGYFRRSTHPHNDDYDCIYYEDVGGPENIGASMHQLHDDCISEYPSFPNDYAYFSSMSVTR